MTFNLARSRFGRALIAIRDADVAAEATGISKPRLLVTVFLFCGAAAAIAGGLFATLQTYITPDAFSFDLSVLFFIAILIGGRGSILGPMLGTIILTLLPEFAAPLAAWSTFLYAVLLLAIVLGMPGGIAAALDFKNRRPLELQPGDRAAPGAACRYPPPRRRRPAHGAGEASSWPSTACGPSTGVDAGSPAGTGPRPHRPERQRQDHVCSTSSRATTARRKAAYAWGRGSS